MATRNKRKPNSQSEEVTRVVGMVLLGLGITLLILCGIALVNAKGLPMVVGFLVCTGVVPVPMIVGGIAIIRSIEDRAAQRLDELEAEPVEEVAGNPVSRTLTRARRFDLNRLNWVGWLLLLATFGFVLAEAAVFALTLGDGAWGGRVGTRLLGLGMVLLAIGFFAGLRGLLRVLGVSIYRR
jgi:hypothetical protein